MFWLLSGQQQAVSTKAVIGGEGMHEKKNHLGRFGNNISIYFYYAIQNNRLCTGADGILKRSIMQHAQFSLDSKDDERPGLEKNTW